MDTSTEEGIPDANIQKYREKFESDPKNLLAQNVCTRHDPFEAALKRNKLTELSNVFSHKISLEGKPVTNQKASGRCWIFALFNCMRVPFLKEYNIEEFEFSQTHIFFWDKVERSNYMLHAFLDAARRGEPADGRLTCHLLSDPINDGGQWNMLVNIVEKYGVMPKKCFPESYNSENSRRLNFLLKNKLREYCHKIYKLVAEGKSDAEIQEDIETMMEEIYRIVSICLGTPPDTLTWEYYDKNKAYQKVGPMSPREFYRKHVKPFFNMEDKICLVNDPRTNHGYNKLYTVEYLGNMSGKKVLYINQPVDVLKKLAAEAIRNDEPVWFGCDVGKHFHGKLGYQDLTLHDYELLFGTSVQVLSKEDRLIFGDSLMTHAMVLTAVTIENNKTIKWRVENSWGEDGQGKGYLVMTDDWFSEYVYEVVIDRKHIQQDILDVLQQEPIVLPAWDPMGALAYKAKL
ncbi:bleomycin hydrolase [Lingula anatina]|uniref:Bleomycin hydrolase n=1 Tax=Lingula anatina TaxID=7574 RepID=A0A1S3H322_LINAN|nr:bleomycin hydrolase [Lingula anatina]|eukprot:XP_013380408.1 bleomycin hydrolase [Lingula anatina]